MLEELFSDNGDSGVGVGIVIAVSDAAVSRGSVDNGGRPCAFLLCRVTRGVGVDGQRDRLNSE